MHKPESVLKDEMNKILLDFAIQTDHLARRADFWIINKKLRTDRIVNFAIPVDLRVKV